MKNRILLAFAAGALALAALAGHADAATTPKIVKYKMLDSSNCAIGTVYTLNVPSPSQNDPSVLHIVVTGTIAPSTPIFGTPVWECTLTTSWFIDDNSCFVGGTTSATVPTIQC